MAPKSKSNPSPSAPATAGAGISPSSSPGTTTLAASSPPPSTSAPSATTSGTGGGAPHSTKSGATGGSGGSSGSTGSTGTPGGAGGGSGRGSTSGSGGSGGVTGGTGGSGGSGGAPRYPVVFDDLRQQETEVRETIENRKAQLKQQQKEQMDFLHPRLKRELALTLMLLDKILVADPLFEGVRLEFEATNQPIVGYRDGLFPTQQPAGKALSSDEKALAAAYGIMLRDGAAVPEALEVWELPDGVADKDIDDILKKGRRNHIPVFQKRFDRRFYDMLAKARAEYSANPELFNSVIDILIQQGKPDDKGQIPVSGKQWAAVVQKLARDGVSADDRYLSMKVVQALAGLERADETAPASSIEIDLPDLEQQTSVEIIADNLKAMQAIYFSAMLEELKIFQVVDKLVELFQMGMLPLGKGNGGDMLYQYWKKSINRLSEYERRNLYARTIGFPGGEGGSNPNREFSSLWLRFVSAVSSFSRQMSLDYLLRADIPARVHQEQVRKSGRDLASNLSLYGYGMAYHAATELQTQINDIIALLSDQEIRNAYGARDMWGVIDQVAMLELGGARDSVRYRTMASSGAIIIRWLANKAQELASASAVRVLDETEIARPSPRPTGTKVTVSPQDSDLVNACERWLAVTGTPEMKIEEYSEPAQAPITPSRPIQIPAIARDALESMGIRGNGFSGL